jgi:hypothetical protein
MLHINKLVMSLHHFSTVMPGGYIPARAFLDFIQWQCSESQFEFGAGNVFWECVTIFAVIEADAVVCDLEKGGVFVLFRVFSWLKNWPLPIVLSAFQKCRKHLQ